MSDTKISALPASTTPLAGAEVLPIVQSGATKQVSVANLTAGRAVATGDLTVTGAASVSGNLTAASFNAASTFGFKNRIINGAMVIDQRNAGASVTPTSAGASYAVDRWATFVTQNSKLTVQRNAGSITPPTGFVNYLGATSSSAYTVISSDYFMLQQNVEGFNVADLGWGTASAATVTLSFWVRSSLTGTFGGSLRNNGDNRTYPFTFTVAAANTWEQKTITVTGDVSGTWTTDNTSGLRVCFGLGVGSSFSGTAGSWTGTSNVFSVTGATSVVGTNGATFYITGVQLEKGITATSFDYRPYGTEFALCQRYFEVCSATYLQAGLATGGANIVAGQYRVTKRATPTLTLTLINGSPGGQFSNAVDNWSASAAPDANGRIGWSATSSAEL